MLQIEVSIESFTPDRIEELRPLIEEWIADFKTLASHRRVGELGEDIFFTYYMLEKGKING